MPKYFLLILFTFIIQRIYPQPPHTFTQFTSETGLAQKMIQSITQDHKGIMWFATWDGLYKFDGYSFKSYKGYPGDNTELLNSRISDIKEDCYGYIWVRSYDYKVYRFNPNTEQFQAIPYDKYSSQDIYVFDSGDVWITTTHKELIQISIDPHTHEMTAIDFFHNHQIKAPNKVNKIYQDTQNNQWILTTNGVHRITKTKKGNTVSTFLHSEAEDCFNPLYDILENNQNIILTSNQGKVWLLQNNQLILKKLPTNSSIKFVRDLTNSFFFFGTDNDGFIIYDAKSMKTSKHTKSSHIGLKSDSILDVYIDRRKDVWMRLNIPGVSHFKFKENKIKHYILKDRYDKNIVDSRVEMNICEDINGSLWIHPSGGGFAWYDYQNENLIPFYNSSLQNGWDADNRVPSFFSDNQGNLWLCSSRNGLEQITFNTHNFHLLPINSKESYHPSNNTRAMYQDNEGYIWVGSKDQIIRIYDQKLNFMGYLTSKGDISHTIKEKLGMAYTFIQDDKGTLWIGTKGNGLIALIRDSLYNDRRLEHFTVTNNKFSINGNEIYDLHIDAQQRLWIATFDGGINFIDLYSKKESVEFISARNLLKNYPIEENHKTRFVTSDSEGKIWIGTTTGLLLCEDINERPEQVKFKKFIRCPGDPYSLSNNDVHNIFVNKNNTIYVATFGGGINKLISLDNGLAKFKSYTKKDGLSSDIILSIEKDANNTLWFVSEEEVFSFDPISEEFTNYQSRLFPKGVLFNEGSALYTKDKQLMFNTTKGIFHFSPDSIKKSNYVPPIVFTDFTLLERKTKSKSKKEIEKNIDDIEHIKLSHRQNGFKIEFSALDMRYPNNILYAYKLEGFESQWNNNGKQRNATYTNLPKGNYKLKVKSTNSDGLWVENTRTVNIIILPSFWETIWAYLLYTLMAGGVIFIVSYILLTIYRLKDRVILEQEISDTKLMFFTNISHELRTPLTLISGPLEQVLLSENIQEQDKEQLILVKRNTNRMLHLVNQILDFRKIQNKKMKMRVQQIDLVPFIKGIMDNFNSIADKYEFEYTLESKYNSLKLWVDIDKLEKILFNLLSNAFKYTPKGKQIKVIIQETKDQIVMSIKDQGIGISEQSQKTLFTRFENLMDKNVFNHPSTGIGLSLVKELVEMHYGTIEVISQQGEGSCFTIRLHKGKDHFDNDTEFILNDCTSLNVDSPYSSLSILTESVPESIDTEKETLLIIEDNVELRFFLRSIFIHHFNVIEAEDGDLGVQKSKLFLPDFIISDIMMPKKDGLEVIQELRNEIMTSHIPIILLTAKATIESKIQGLEYGADDYITKPFSATYLKARVFNLLEQRKKIQSLYYANLHPTSILGKNSNSKKEETETTNFKLSTNDTKFMNLVMEIIEKNIDNSNLKIGDLADEVNMSRSVFFKKIKSLTGVSPVEFLKNQRMKRATELIKIGEYNMSEIAYMVGISDSHYFSKCFKQQYGMTPTEYKEKSLN